MKNLKSKKLLFIILLFLNSCKSEVNNENNIKSTNKEALGSLINYSEKEVDLPLPLLTVKEDKFEVSVGKSINKFKYTSKGELLYNEKSFSPKITTSVESVKSFKIFTPKTKNNAGAIQMDGDGQNQCYLLDLDNMISTVLTDNTYYFQEMYWSPSSKYLITFAEYEGESLCISINSKTKKVMIKDLKQGNDSNTLWVVDNNPVWEIEKDILLFRVAEYYNPFSSNYNNEDYKKVLRKYNVKLDVSNLKLNILNKNLK